MKEKQGLIEQLNENNITAASTYAPDIAKNLKQYWKVCDYYIKSDLDESEERIDEILQIEQNFKEAVDLRKSISQKDEDIKNRLSQFKKLKKVYSSFFKSVDLSYNYTESTDKLTSVLNTLDEFLTTLDGNHLSAYESIVAKDKSTTPAQWFSKNGEDSELLLIEKMRSLTADTVVVVSKQHDPVVTIIKKDEEEAKAAEEKAAKAKAEEEARLVAEEKTSKEASKDAKKTDVSQIAPVVGQGMVSDIASSSGALRPKTGFVQSASVGYLINGYLSNSDFSHNGGLFAGYDIGYGLPFGLFCGADALLIKEFVKVNFNDPSYKYDSNHLIISPKICYQIPINASFNPFFGVSYGYDFIKKYTLGLFVHLGGVYQFSPTIGLKFSASVCSYLGIGVSAGLVF